MSFKPKNMPQMSPYLVVRDIKKSMDFYNKALGFEIEHQSKDENGEPEHVSMRFGESIIMFCQEGAWGTIKKSPATQNILMPINMYLYCKDADALYKQALANGAKSMVEPSDAFWGDRFCSVLDPDNYEWCLATSLSQG
jgi:uncharacterized glyoxalase superfamily protein PhnB